ncbi:DUF4870 family protein [Methylomonas koyamae]|uniref:DUF4870 family protein n=1 Tax=Methylomonas koyamae TaxID=702114 RepID=UPI000BC31709|nr:hypothetical protein [Methylomonas koyamae]ATG90129.1 membrane protein [Methylomonas koyamae]
MNTPSIEQAKIDSLQSLKRLTATVYLCQVLTFTFLGLPLLVGAAINFYKRKEAEGTWLESHFESQIKTTWVALIGFAVSGLTFEIGVGFITLMITLLWMIYRIAVGWYALTDGKPVND